MAEVNIRSSSLKRKEFNLNMLNYLSKRAISPRQDDHKKLTEHLFDTAKDLYKKDLTSHFGCVNAIEFSSDGNLLFSGGDDRRVLMWNVNNALMYYTGKSGDGAKPSVMANFHYSNIFCLAVDDENKRVLSGSNDDQVIVHDYKTGRPLNHYLHDSPVFSLSLHPNNGNVFASAADNGKILVYDTRVINTEPLCLAKLKTPFHGVMFNPCEPSLVASANSRLGVHIWDLRKPKEILLECTNEQSMAVRWNQSGTILLALRNLLPPVIYDPLTPKKCLEFDSDCYYNACTMKSCCFAGEKDEYILSGSDDFNLYMWKIPNPWPESKCIKSAHLSLTGHRSIVNQVRYNPSKQLIATSGVEKIVKIWSLFRLPYSEGDRDMPSPKRPRVLCTSGACPQSEGYALSHDFSHESMDEDTKMIHFFDSLLRNELSQVSVPQSNCVDGKLYPVPNRKKETKHYLELIEKKKERLSKILMEKSDDMPPQCNLRQSPPQTFPNSKRYHFSLEENRLVSASEDDESIGEIFPGQEDSSSPDDGNIFDENCSSSSSPLCTGTDFVPSSSSTSSYVNTLTDDPVGSDSTSSNNSDKPKNSSLSFKDSGINLSDSSDSDMDSSSIFKRKKVHNNRCYRNSMKRKKGSSTDSTDSSEGELSRKKKKRGEGSKVLNLGNSSDVFNNEIGSDADHENNVNNEDNVNVEENNETDEPN